MGLAAGCPRCSAPVAANGHGWTCRDHGEIAPLWRVSTPTYSALTEHLERAGPLPTFLPWPLRPGWGIADFGSVEGTDGAGRASFVTCAGSNDLDGVVEVTLVAEEPGVGLGARIAVVDHTDPGSQIDGPAHARITIEGREVALWSVSTSERDADFDRSVFAGEAHGRWVWIVLRPASAALLLSEPWVFQDLSTFGPQLLDVPFLDVPKPW